MIYELKILYLGLNKVRRLSYKSTQLRGDKSDFVRTIYELAVIPNICAQIDSFS